MELSEYYKKKICFFIYCILHYISSNEDVVEWADFEINTKENIPYFIYDMSLAKSLKDQFGIIKGIMFDYNLKITDYLPVEDIICQIKKVYDSEREPSYTIRRLYQFTDYLRDVDSKYTNDMLDDIYVLDYHDEDLYYEKKNKIEKLEVELNSFFMKYSKSY